MSRGVVCIYYVDYSDVNNVKNQQIINCKCVELLCKAPEIFEIKRFASIRTANVLIETNT